LTAAWCRDFIGIVRILTTRPGNFIEGAAGGWAACRAWECRGPAGRCAKVYEDVWCTSPNV
jgi:hypothetical protein